MPCESAPQPLYTRDSFSEMNPAIIEKPRRAVKTRQKNRQIVGARHAVPANVSCTDAKNASGSKQSTLTTSTRYKLNGLLRTNSSLARWNHRHAPSDNPGE